MTTSFALGEVQTPGKPALRHAVADATPGSWATAICPRAPRVWVHEVAGAVVPFPGLNDAFPCCMQCFDLVLEATKKSAAEKGTVRTALEWLERWRGQRH